MFYPCNRDDSGYVKENRMLEVFYPCNRDDSVYEEEFNPIVAFYPCNRDDSMNSIGIEMCSNVLSL